MSPQSTAPLPPRTAGVSQPSPQDKRLRPRRPLGSAIRGCAGCTNIVLPAGSKCQRCGGKPLVTALPLAPRTTPARAPVPAEMAPSGWHEHVLLPLLEALVLGKADPADAAPALRDLRHMLATRKRAAAPRTKPTLRKR